LAFAPALDAVEAVADGAEAGAIFEAEAGAEFDDADVEVAGAGAAAAGFAGADGVEGAGEFPAGAAEQHELPSCGVEEQHAGFGAETPAMPDPSPSFCKLGASNFPLASRPFAD
jgi:hypothetical protein